MLSLRTKESIKTALAVVIAFAIAFYMGWEKPFWSAFAVVMISLDTTGQSLNKAAMRMLGTVVGVCAAFAFVSLFPQQRWALLAVVSVYIGFCVYMLAGDQRRYFWFVSAFVCLVIIIDGAPHPANVFSIAVARFEETAMGIMVYAVVSMLLWPTNSQDSLEKSAQQLFAAQVELYRASLAQTAKSSTSPDLQKATIQEVRLLGQFEAALDAAIHDSYAAWEVRRQWRQYRDLSQAIMQTLGRWRETFDECRDLDLRGLLPNLDAFTAELDERAQAIARMLEGNPPQRPLSPIKLDVSRAAARELSHFDRAALSEFKTQLDLIEDATRALYQCVQDIKGFGASRAVGIPAKEQGEGLGLDPDRLHASAMVVATLFVAFCVWIYVDPPTHSLFVFLATQWAMVSVLTRQSVVSTVPGFLVAYLVGGITYVFVMPKLSSYAELGPVLFVIVFALFWLFFEPKNRMTRTGALANFLVVISLENDQSYDFANFLSIAAGTGLSLGLAILTQSVPFSPRPEKVFLRLLNRFFSQVAFLLTCLSVDWERQRGPVGLLQTALYRSDILRIPVRLAGLVEQIDYRVLPGTTPEQVRDLTASLQSIAYRINELMDTREPERTNPLVLELLDDLRDWRRAARDLARHWAEDPGAPPPVDIEQRLTDRIQALERRIGETRERFDPEALSPSQYEGLYRVVGAFRALAASGITYATLTSKIPWKPWKEARF